MNINLGKEKYTYLIDLDNTGVATLDEFIIKYLDKDIIIETAWEKGSILMYTKDMSSGYLSKRDYGESVDEYVDKTDKYIKIFKRNYKINKLVY